MAQKCSQLITAKFQVNSPKATTFTVFFLLAKILQLCTDSCSCSLIYCPKLQKNKQTTTTRKKILTHKLSLFLHDNDLKMVR